MLFCKALLTCSPHAEALRLLAMLLKKLRLLKKLHHASKKIKYRVSCLHVLHRQLSRIQAKHLPTSM